AAPRGRGHAALGAPGASPGHAPDALVKSSPPGPAGPRRAAASRPPGSTTARLPGSARVSRPTPRAALVAPPARSGRPPARLVAPAHALRASAAPWTGSAP